MVPQVQQASIMKPEMVQRTRMVEKVVMVPTRVQVEETYEEQD
eukprot:gene4848-2220_t